MELKANMRWKEPVDPMEEISSKLLEQDWAGVPPGAAKYLRFARTRVPPRYSLFWHPSPKMTTAEMIKDRAPLIVANHMAFIDVLLAMSQACPSFVAKGDMRRVPVVGPIASQLDCVFVPRAGANRAPHDTAAGNRRLGSGGKAGDATGGGAAGGGGSAVSARPEHAPSPDVKAGGATREEDVGEKHRSRGGSGGLVARAGPEAGAGAGRSRSVSGAGRRASSGYLSEGGRSRGSEAGSEAEGEGEGGRRGRASSRRSSRSDASGAGAESEAEGASGTGLRRRGKGSASGASGSGPGRSSSLPRLPARGGACGDATTFAELLEASGRMIQGTRGIFPHAAADAEHFESSPAGTPRKLSAGAGAVLQVPGGAVGEHAGAGGGLLSPRSGKVAAQEPETPPPASAPVPPPPATPPPGASEGASSGALTASATKRATEAFAAQRSDGRGADVGSGGPHGGASGRRAGAGAIRHSGSRQSAAGGGGATQVIVRRLRRLERGRAAGLTDKDRAPLLVFPEGTTTNGTGLLRFRTGSFRAGVPLQPLLISFQWRTHSPSWETVPFWAYVHRLLTQVSHSASLEWMPAVHPGKSDRRSAAVYAERVRQSMGAALALPCYPYGLEDKWQLHKHVLAGRLHWQFFNRQN